LKKLPLNDEDFRGLAHIATRLEFFRSFKGAKLERVLSRIELYSFDKGETVFHKGGPPDAFYIIYQGRVRIHLGYNFLGLMRKMVHLGPGDLFGEMAIVEKRVHSGTAVVEQPAKLFVLLYEEFDSLLKSEPEVANLIKFVVSRRKEEKK